jgi:hemerythrin
MAHIEWSSDLDTHIPVIDKQHHRIVEYINNLYDISETHDREEVGRVLQELVDYTLSHFAFEESMMEEAGYPFIKGHKSVHDLFTKRVGDFMTRFKMGEDITDELLTVLKSWLINHIKSDDNDYADAVRANMAGSNVGNESWLSKSVKRFFG